VELKIDLLVYRIVCKSVTPSSIKISHTLLDEKSSVRTIIASVQSPSGFSISPFKYTFPFSTTIVLFPSIFDAPFTVTVAPHIFQKYNIVSQCIACHLEPKSSTSKLELLHVLHKRSKDDTL
jgi:hypothetical protein